MPSFGEVDGKVAEMRPVVRGDKRGDAGPHSPQRPALAEDDEQQAQGDHHAKHRLYVVECRRRARAGTQMQVVERHRVVEDQQSGENPDDDASEQHESTRLHCCWC